MLCTPAEFPVEMTIRRDSKVSKRMSLLFATASVCMMAATGIALSYRIPWLAGMFFLLTFATIAAGFIVKSRLR
jgi:fatty acid desaturase